MVYDLPCDWRAGFVPDPTKKQRAGYLVSFNGLDMGEFLRPDLTVYTPFTGAQMTYGGLGVAPTTGKVTCVGVLERFSWTGGVADPLCISAYTSPENAVTLVAKLKDTLKTTKVTKLAWWICNYDEENKVWYEESFPKSAVSVSGQLNVPGGKDVRLTVGSDPVQVAVNIDTKVYSVYFEVVPAAAKEFGLRFATSAKTKFVRKWGLVVSPSPGGVIGV